MAGKAQFRAQARALFRRNASLQRRSPCANLFIILTPVLLIVLLLVLQILVDIAFSSDDSKCGCLCLSCCDTIDGVETCREATADNPCISVRGMSGQSPVSPCIALRGLPAHSFVCCRNSVHTTLCRASTIHVRYMMKISAGLSTAMLAKPFGAP